MSYQHDVFLSYRRHGEWPHWVKEIFRPLLYHWLGEEISRPPQIFVDTDMETGDSWPERLAKELGRSRILVPLFSRQYFSSPWCQAELAHMLARESKCSLRTLTHPEGLIVPAHIHDGEDFPKRAKDIQSAFLQKYTNVRLAKGGQTEELLSGEIRDWAPDIANAIKRAPAYDPDWPALSLQLFKSAITTADPEQISPPSLG